MAADGVAKNQVSNKRASIDGGTRLRRRLSKIFHQERADIGFAMYEVLLHRTLGNNQPAICQSPRIHLWRLLTSTA